MSTLINVIEFYEKFSYEIQQSTFFLRRSGFFFFISFWKAFANEFGSLSSVFCDLLNYTLIIQLKSIMFLLDFRVNYILFKAFELANIFSINKNTLCEKHFSERKSEKCDFIIRRLSEPHTLYTLYMLLLLKDYDFLSTKQWRKYF